MDKIQKLYEEKGFFLAGVDYEITPTKDKEKVQLTFKIREGDNVMVKQIRFIGNQKISSSKLKTYLRTSEGGFFLSFLIVGLLSKMCLIKIYRSSITSILMKDLCRLRLVTLRSM